MNIIVAPDTIHSYKGKFANKFKSSVLVQKSSFSKTKS